MAHRRPVLSDLTNRSRAVLPTKRDHGVVAAAARAAPVSPIPVPECKPTKEKKSAPYQAELEVRDYLETIWKTDKKAEDKYLPPVDYMEQTQVEVTADMRGVCLDWTIELASRFKMGAATTFLTANILDRFLAKKPIRRERMQMVTMVSLIIAAKYEEIYPPRIKEYIYISANSFSREDILRYEHYILHALNYSLTTPTPYHFITRYVYSFRDTSQPEEKSDRELRHAACMIAECAMLSLSLYLSLKPSLLGAAAVYAARTLQHRDPSFSSEHSSATVSELGNKLLTHTRSVRDTGKLKAIFKRYSDESRLAVTKLL